jgi:hypothetical protein
MADWFPGSRAAQLAMAKTWLTVFSVKAPEWGIPSTEVTGLSTLTADADALLVQAMSSDRTPVITARCTAAFNALEDKMRYIKKHFLLSPPLSEADIISLLLTPEDTTRSPIPKPEGFPEADVSYPGVNTLELHPRPVAGQPPLDLRSDYGYRIYWGVLPPGGATVEAATGSKRELMKPPASGAELPHSLWTRRRRERFTFTGDGGKTAWFCVRYENSKGDAGNWGPMFSAVIP